MYSIFDLFKASKTLRDDSSPEESKSISIQIHRVVSHCYEIHKLRCKCCSWAHLISHHKESTSGEFYFLKKKTTWLSVDKKHQSKDTQ